MSYRIIHSDDIPDPAPLPDPEELQVRWTMMRIPPAIIEKHVALLKAKHEQRQRQAERERAAEAERVRNEVFNPIHGPRRDLTGKRYGHLTVLRLYDQRPGKHYRWLCECTCGAVLPVYATNMKRRHSSCPDCANKHRADKRRKVPIPEVERLLRKGWRQSAIAAKVNCTQANISVIAIKLGLRGRSEMRIPR